MEIIKLEGKISSPSHNTLWVKRVFQFLAVTQMKQFFCRGGVSVPLSVVPDKRMWEKLGDIFGGLGRTGRQVEGWPLLTALWPKIQTVSEIWENRLTVWLLKATSANQPREVALLTFH